MKRARRSAVLAAAVAVAGCGSPSEPRTEAKAPKQQHVDPAAPTDLESGPLGEHRSDRFNIRLPLPDSPSWTIEDHRSQWLEAKHQNASARLLVRVWREASVANRSRCEAQARLWKDLPDRERSEIIDQRRIDAPRGFDTMAYVGIVASRNDQPITGFVMAFGARVRRCFAYVLTTTAEGKGAEKLIAARLATMVELSLSGVTLEDDREPSIQREPLH